MGSDLGLCSQNIVELLTSLILVDLILMLHSHQMDLMETNILAPSQSAFVHSTLNVHLLCMYISVSNWQQLIFFNKQLKDRLECLGAHISLLTNKQLEDRQECSSVRIFFLQTTCMLALPASSSKMNQSVQMYVYSSF